MTDSFPESTFRSLPSLRMLLGSLLALNIFLGGANILKAQTPGVQLGRPAVEPTFQFRQPILQAAYIQPPTGGRETEPKKPEPPTLKALTERERMLPSELPAEDQIKARLKSVLENDTSTRKVLVASLLSESATVVRGERVRTNYPNLWMTYLFPQLVEAVNSTDDLLLIRKGLEALSQLQADPVQTAKVLEEYLSHENAEVRLEAAKGLTRLAEVLQALNQNPPSFTYSAFSTEPAEVRNREQEEKERAEIWDRLQRGRIAIVEAVRRKMPTTSNDQRLQLELVRTLETIVNGLIERTNLTVSEDRLLGTSGTPAEIRNRFRPILQALQGATGALIQIAGTQSDPRIRVYALLVLEKLAQVRNQLEPTNNPEQPPLVGQPVGQSPVLSRRVQSRTIQPIGPPMVHRIPQISPPITKPQLWKAHKPHINFDDNQPEVLPPPASASDPLGQGFLAQVDELTQRLTDPNVRVRLAAVEVLEGMAELSEPAIPSLVQATNDSNRFVRWAAARTLGRLSPKQPETVVPALATMLNERDMDLRIAAARALERYGEKATLAVPALAASIQRGDAEYRIVGMEALKEMGELAAGSTPVVALNLRHVNDRVRVVAAETLGAFGPRAASAVPALRQVLSDRNVDVRRAANEAIFRVTTPE